MGIKSILANTAGKAGNRIAKMAALSPEQLIEVQEKRENYLLEMPDPMDSAAEEMTKRLLATSGIEIYNAYLTQLKALYVPMKREAEYGEPFKVGYNIRYLNITKWVIDRKENGLEKLVNVYEVLSNEECNIALVFQRTRLQTNVYLAVTNTQNANKNSTADNYIARLSEAIKGNFPGAEWKAGGVGVLPCFDDKSSYSVASASNVPTEKSEKFISQTIEKLLDGSIPESREKEYTIILLATPIQNMEERKLRLEELYSGLYPYASWTTDFHYTESDSTGSSATIGINVGASAGIQNGQNQSVTRGESESISDGKTETDSENLAESDSSSQSDATSQSRTDTRTEGRTETSSQNTGWTSSESNTITESAGTSLTETEGRTDMSSNSQTISENKSTTLGGGVNVTVGASGTQTVNYGGGIGIPGIINAQGGGSTSGTVSGSLGANINLSGTEGEGIADTISESVSNMRTNAATITENNSVSQSMSESVSGSTGSSLARMQTNAEANTSGNSLTKTIGKSVTNSVGKAVAKTLGKAVTSSVSNATGAFKSMNFGANFGANFARSSSVTATIGKNEGITQSFTNYTIKHALELLENQMERMEEGTALGMWDFAAYVLSEDQNMANNVAHSYIALTQGEESYMSRAAINMWRGDTLDEESQNAREICEYLKELRHPVFGLNPQIYNQSDEEMLYAYPAIVNATTSLSGKELAFSLNFPQKSIAGLPVIECTEFGRNIVTYDVKKNEEEERKLNIGRIFHMNREEKTRVELSKQSLASHTFITGSTGSGKSNTVYQIIKEAKENGLHFLVVEPAKGEYKSVFGMEEDVFVFGTNPELTPMLKINPFSFPKGVHVLEHLDRLVEIFNVCWPMYAAMPAVLKQAVEKAYMDCGWNLNTSRNKYGEDLYPTFADVAYNVKHIIDSSEYDNENKGAYKGALLTRLQSLTNGINGMIFVQNEISPADLFDRDVIVDLSRVGSSETKSLLMGMLVLKLQEYRMTSTDSINARMRHLTVLEEAHNLLRRTSIEQLSESANLMGKSVEMLSNAIAEMRTYGEGFVIVDQAPGLLDMAIIRNTNTKIIMRLPDRGDRELVGKAANLNDDQIIELAKLPCGVAAVYQNEWVQPVLCKVDKYQGEIRRYSYSIDEAIWEEYAEKNYISESLLDCIMNREIFQINNRESMQRLKESVVKSKLDTLIKRDVLEYIASEKDSVVNALRTLVYDFFCAEEAIKAARNCEDISEWVHSVVSNLHPSISSYSNEQIDLVIALVLYEQSMRDPSYDNILCSFTEIYKSKGEVY